MIIRLIQVIHLAILIINNFNQLLDMCEYDQLLIIFKERKKKLSHYDHYPAR